MKDEYDFSNAKRGAVASSKGKTRITIMLDDVVIEAARASAESEGYGYQTVINNTLRQALLSDKGKMAKPDQNTAVANVGHFKKGITASELKSLEKKLSEALSEIQHVMELEVRS
ncbi:S-adenosylhomocysteine hydrolase [Pseudomonas sp. F-14 TE3623]|uniref:BrnA antitoxin family protein n=1 Tax=Pseudomonas farris TaxID=2841207 RepID=A0ABS6Q1N5_9PSED|nr:BrnA antitoxin family protein [Pseudomonas farris]MBV4466638.1 BrnA antitoxin family protein [Pseudomonas farris]